MLERSAAKVARCVLRYGVCPLLDHVTAGWDLLNPQAKRATKSCTPERDMNTWSDCTVTVHRDAAGTLRL